MTLTIRTAGVRRTGGAVVAERGVQETARGTGADLVAVAQMSADGCFADRNRLRIRWVARWNVADGDLLLGVSDSRRKPGDEQQVRSAAQRAGLLRRPRDEHRHLLAVGFVARPMGPYHVALLELDGDEDVCGRRDGEDEVGDGHRRRRPEGHDEAEIDGVPDVAVPSARRELHRRVGHASQEQEDLPEAEEIEVIDEERADQHDHPAREGEPLEQQAERLALDLPDHASDRLPLPEEQEQRRAGRQHEGAALERLGDDFRPDGLEALPGHHAVLQREDGEKHGIGQQCRAQRPRRRGIDRLRDDEVGDEADGVEERDQEDRVRDQPIDEEEDSLHCRASLVARHVTRCRSGKPLACLGCC